MRTRTPDGRRVVIAVRVSESAASAIDLARGGQSRSSWLQSLIAAELEGAQAPAPATSANSRVPGPAPAPAARGRPAARKRCQRPGTRVIGGWCPDCEVLVESGGELPAAAVCERTAG